MKKYLFILATAAIVASCSDMDTFKKDIQTGDSEAISFETFATKQTRATENSTANYDWDLFDHHNTFEVWGFKNTDETAVFTKDVVTVDEVTPATNPRTFTYTYSPTRYWDKAATVYEFYAAAPSSTDGNWTFNKNGLVAAELTDASKQHKGYFTTSSTLTGTNIADGTTTYMNSFKTGNGDVDKLIAAPKTVYKVHFSQKIQLNFIHILSRLNVTVKKAQILENQTVIVKSLEVKNLLPTGAFNENSDGASTTGNNSRWTPSGTAITYSAPANVTVTAAITTSTPSPAPQYLIQALVIPQDAAHESVALDGKAHTASAAQNFTLAEYNAYYGTDLNQAAFEALSDADKVKIPAESAAVAVASTTNPYLKIVYTIQGTTGTAEEFTAYFNLAAAFGLDGVDHRNDETPGVDESKLAFNEGWQNTLNITINPDAIEFCAKVAEWSEVDNDLEIK